MSWLRRKTSNESTPRRRAALAGAIALVAVSCEFKLEAPPPDPMVRGPTLETTLAGIANGDFLEGQLVAARPLNAAAQAAHGQFLADVAEILDGGGGGGEDGSLYVAATRIRVTLGPGAVGVAGFEDAFSGLGVFVAPEDQPAARVVLGSVPVPQGRGPISLELLANQRDYAMAQGALGQSRFLVGIEGPTGLRADEDFRFDVRVDLDMAVVGDLDD